MTSLSDKSTMLNIMFGMVSFVRGFVHIMVFFV